MSQSIILLVLSFNRRNLELLTQVLKQANYQVIAISNYVDLDKALSDNATVHLGLIDLAGCDRSIWHYCEQLQALKIPFLTFTPQYNRVVEQDSLARGARSVLVKPLVIKNLLLLIHSLVVKPE
jgi:DNA-binding response OmpR family regulator